MMRMTTAKMLRMMIITIGLAAPAHPAPSRTMMKMRKPMTMAIMKMRIITVTRRMMIAIGLGQPDTPGASQPPTPPPLFKATVANLMMANRRDCFFRN